NQAKRLFLTAQKINAQEMLAIGFLTEVVEASRLKQRLDELSTVVAGMAPIALLGIKKHLNLIAQGHLHIQAIEAAVRASEASVDIQEGARAWKEKRLPIFVGE